MKEVCEKNIDLDAASLAIKEVPNCKIEFVMGSDGNVSELQFQQGGFATSLKKRT